jgi:acyl-CoA synthetase (AMP-forming)/AMP-acid ligase II
VTRTTTTRILRSPLPAPRGVPPVVAALRHATSDPGRLAVADGATGERFSRGEVAARSAALAAGLADRGIGRGDIVAVLMPNLAWWPVVALGVWRAGAAIAPLSPFWKAEEMGRLLTCVRPAMAIAAGPLVSELRGALATAEVAAEIAVHGEAEGETPLDQLLADNRDNALAEPRLDPSDLAIVPFSSGLGGLPKGVRHAHGSLAAVSAQVAASLGLGAASVALAGAPVYHAMGLCSSLCAPLSVGARIVTLPFPKPERIIELIAEHRVTHATLPPTIVAQIAADPGGDGHDTASLELVLTGGADVPAAVQLRAGDRLGGVVRQAYGMTEALAISASLGEPSHPETVGWLAAGTEARLVDPESRRDVASGQPGELLIRGPQVMEGYHDDPDATAATLTADGWLRTGDLVEVLDDGQLVIRDRLKELIKVKGASVAPAELELVLAAHPSVGNALVVRRPDPDRGEVPVAYVVPARPVAAEELVSFVASRVASYKRLHDVFIVDELPRTAGAAR